MELHLSKTFPFLRVTIDGRRPHEPLCAFTPTPTIATYRHFTFDLHDQLYDATPPPLDTIAEEESIDNHPLPHFVNPPPSPAAVKQPVGSCHCCKNTRQVLHQCQSNRWPKKCKLKFCDKCLQKLKHDKPVCPRCLGTCTCAACKRKVYKECKIVEETRIID